MTNLSQNGWQAAVDADENALLIDVRTPAECAEGMQENAQEMDIMNANAFMAMAENIDTSKNLYIYCRSGARSAQACGYFDSKGFTTYNLLGGMMEWQGKVVTK